MRNSWGSYWGDRGFFKMSRGTNTTGIESLCSWVTLDNHSRPVYANWGPENSEDGHLFLSDEQQMEKTRTEALKKAAELENSSVQLVGMLPDGVMLPNGVVPAGVVPKGVVPQMPRGTVSQSVADVVSQRWGGLGAGGWMPAMPSFITNAWGRAGEHGSFNPESWMSEQLHEVFS